VLSVDLSMVEKEPPNSGRMRSTKLWRLSGTGSISLAFGPSIVQQGENQILVQLPGVKDPERALELIGRTAQLEFKLVDEDNAAKFSATGVRARGRRSIVDEVEEQRDRDCIHYANPYQKAEPADRGFTHRCKGQISGDVGGEGTYVAIEFNSAGARLFDQITGANVGKRLAIVLDIRFTRPRSSGSGFPAERLRSRVALRWRKLRTWPLC